jgi:hypothetical protein
MHRGRFCYLAVLAGALALASAPRMVRAASIPSQPVAGAPAGWMHTDIGVAAEGGLPGDTKYDPATGQWTVSGSGSDLWDTAHDDIQFAFTPVKGDGSITGRLLSTSGAGDAANSGGWEKIGLMIRADMDDTTDSALSQVEMTNRNGGVYWHFRPGKASSDYGEIQGRSSREVGDSPNAWPYPKLFMRTQRVDGDLSGFISYDGKLWRNVGWTLGETDFSDTAFFGMSVLSHTDSTLSTAVWDNVAATAGEVTPYGVYAVGGDKSATLNWLALKGATGYNVFRGPANAGYDELTPDMLKKLTATPITDTKFTDSDASLAPATRYVYAVTAVVNNAETMPVVARANIGGASSTLPGFTSVNIGNDPLRIGRLKIDAPHGDTGADFNSATGLIKINGGGFGIGNPNNPSTAADTADEFNFTHQTVTGNFQVTVNALRFPTYQGLGSGTAGGLMIREDLTPGARNAFLTLTDDQGVIFQSRTTKGGTTTVNSPEAIGSSSVTYSDVRDQLNSGKPVAFRLTRKGDSITAEYSLDGTTFKAATGSPITLSGLGASVEVGLAITAATPDNDTKDAELRISEMILRDLKVTPQ